MLVFPLQDYTVRNVRRALLVLLGAVAMVLLIACVNVANLLLVRGAARSKELAIRGAIGASRDNWSGSCWSNSSRWPASARRSVCCSPDALLRGLLALLPNTLPRQAHIGLDGSCSLALLLTVITPLLFGLLPALQASRLDLRELLAAGGRQSAQGTGRGVRRVLVVAELALAMMLLIGAGLLIRTFGQLASVSPGFSPDHSFAGTSACRTRGMPRAARGIDNFFSELLSRTRAAGRDGGRPDPEPPDAERLRLGLRDRGRLRRPIARPTFDELLRRQSRLLRRDAYSRASGSRNRGRRSRRIVARRGHQPGDGRSPVLRAKSHRQAHQGLPGPERLARDCRRRRRHEAVRPERAHADAGLRAVPTAPVLSSFSIVVRTGADDPTAMVPGVRGVVRSLDRQLPLARVRTLDDVVSASIRPQRFSATLIALFGAAALILAAIGVYGVMLYSVRLRTQELAIRIAHGATWSDILSLVLRGAIVMAALGIGIGLAGAWLLRQAIEKLLFGVAPDDVGTYVAVAALLSLVAMTASVIPALRATRVDPLVALRET